VQDQSGIETIKAQGGQLVDLVKQLVHEGNVRRIVIQQDGRTVVEFPLTLGVVGVALAPMLAAVGAAAALLTDCTIQVERTNEPGEQPPVQVIDITGRPGPDSSERPGAEPR
jgi:hypothetical protein